MSSPQDGEHSNESAPIDPKTPPILPPEAEKALEKLVEQGGPKALLAIVAAVSRTTNVGPDPETARILAESEKHSEELRLQGYKANLENRDKQNGRDHQFRCKRLNHDTAKTMVVLTVFLVGVGVGLYLLTKGNTAVGTPILVAAVMGVLQILSGRLPVGTKSD